MDILYLYQRQTGTVKLHGSYDSLTSDPKTVYIHCNLISSVRYLCKYRCEEDETHAGYTESVLKCELLSFLPQPFLKLKKYMSRVIQTPGFQSGGPWGPPAGTTGCKLEVAIAAVKFSKGKIFFFFSIAVVL